MKKKRTEWVRPGLVILGLGLLGGCSLLLLLISIVVPRLAAYQPGFTPELTRIFAAQIQQGDVPDGYVRQTAQVRELLGVEGRLFYFLGAGRQQRWVAVSQEVYVFDNPDLAKHAFEERLATMIPSRSADKHVYPSVLLFPHQADQLQGGCLPSNINGIESNSCVVVARYDDMVIMLVANVFEDRWLTITDFRRVLEAMDRRAVAANAQH
jgi:hypothetical protein